MHAALASLLFLMLQGASAPAALVEVDIQGMRNARGLIQACLTRNPKHFPDCRRDPSALRQTVPATVRQLRFVDVPPGRYAVTVFHDSNANARLDTFLGIPREGFGFSRNPTIRFGAPQFESVDIELGPGFTRAGVRMQYLL